MITVQGYFKAKQPAEYKELEQRYPLPVLPSWEAGVTVGKTIGEFVEQEELTWLQRQIDRMMRRRPVPGKGE